MHNIIIKTERLLLRPLTVSDAKEIFEWVSDGRVAKYMIYNTYTSLDQAVKWLKHLESVTEEYHFGFVRTADHKLIGNGSISPDTRKAGFWEIGYNLRHSSWGYGYATEAAKAIITYAYENLSIRKFSSNHAEPNTASGNVLKKCGFHFAGFGEFQKLDGSCKMRSMEYELER